MNFEPTKLENQWFFLDVEIFHSRVFVFVGTRKDMAKTAEATIRDKFHQHDAKKLANFVRHKFEGRWGQHCTNGDSFGFLGNVFIRLDSMTTGNIFDILIFNHECLHAANQILRYIELREDDNIEGLCYTHEYIFGKLMLLMCVNGIGKEIEVKEPPKASQRKVARREGKK